jgi:hypothetical protein
MRHEKKLHRARMVQFRWPSPLGLKEIIVASMGLLTLALSAFSVVQHHSALGAFPGAMLALFVGTPALITAIVMTTKATRQATFKHDVVAFAWMVVIFETALWVFVMWYSARMGSFCPHLPRILA